MAWKIWIRLALILACGGIGKGCAQELRSTNLGDCRLESGDVIRECRVAYRTFGRLNSQRSNAVLFPTWFSGTSAELTTFFGPGKMVDTDRFFVIAVDAFGNGVSSSPSKSKQQADAAFPRFTIKDMVDAQYRLVRETLNINKLHAVVGISMGGMQAFQWMVRYPEMMDRAVPMMGSPRLDSTDQLLWQAQLRAIEQAQQCEPDEHAGLPAVAAMHLFALQTPEYRSRQTPSEALPVALRAQEERMKRYYHSWDYASQLRAMLSLNVALGLGSWNQLANRVRAKTLVVVAARDHVVNPAPALDFAKALEAETLVLDGDCGHMAFDCEGERMRARVRDFLTR